MWREESEKSSEFPMEIETAAFESQNRFHCKLYLKMLPNLVKKSTQWNSNSKVHNFVLVRHTFTTIFLTARTYPTLVFPQRVSFFPSSNLFKYPFR